MVARPSVVARIRSRYPKRCIVRLLRRRGVMLRTLRASRLDNSCDAEMIALATVDLLVLDDFELEPMSKEKSRDVSTARASSPSSTPATRPRRRPRRSPSATRAHAPGGADDDLDSRFGSRHHRQGRSARSPGPMCLKMGWPHGDAKWHADARAVARAPFFKSRVIRRRLGEPGRA